MVDSRVTNHTKTEGVAGRLMRYDVDETVRRPFAGPAEDARRYPKVVEQRMLFAVQTWRTQTAESGDTELRRGDELSKMQGAGRPDAGPSDLQPSMAANSHGRNACLTPRPVNSIIITNFIVIAERKCNDYKIHLQCHANL